MTNFENKLNPSSVIISVLSELTSDEFIEITLSSGISFDLALTKEENFSNKTRLRKYIPLVNNFIRNLDDESALNCIFVVMSNLIARYPEREQSISEKLNAIGWKIIEGTIAPAEKNVHEMFFEKGLIHSAYVKIKSIIGIAKSDIWIIDPYIGSENFEILKSISQKVEIKFLTMNISGDFEHEKSLFLKEYTNFSIEVKKTKDFHDRFIIIDSNQIFHLGASIKDAGNKVFMINEITDENIKNSIIDSFNERWKK